MKPRAVCFLLLLFPFCAMAQRSVLARIDSLKQLLSESRLKNDEHRVTVLAELCRAYRFIEYGKGIPFGEQSLALAEKIHWTPGITKAEMALAGCYWAKSDYVYALALAQKALDNYKELHDQTGICGCLNTIGAIVYGESQYEKALDYFKQALELNRGDASILENIAQTYDVMKKYDLAVEYFRRAMSLYQQQGKVVNAVHSLNSVGYVLVSLGRYPEAERTLRQALDLSLRQNDSAGLQLGFQKLGLLELAKGQYLKAIAFFEKEHILLTFFGDKGKLAENDDRIGATYLLIAKGQEPQHGFVEARKRSLETAVGYFRQAVALSRTVSSWNIQLEYERDLCEASILDQRPGEAVRALKQYAAFSDSLYNKEAQRKFTENLLTYDFNRQRDSLSHQAALEHLHRRQDLLFAILAVAIISLAALGIVFKNRLERLRLKNRLNDVTFAALRSQMNPHFIFNCLNSIKLYTEQNDSPAASAYLTKFSRLIRAMLQNSRNETIPLSSELELLQLYMEMEALRFKEKFHFSIDVSPEIGVDLIEIPSLLVQPYVENAIWHGLMHKESGGHIYIRVSERRDDAILEISIQDDGIGRAAAQALRSKTATRHKSFGIKLADERIRLVNEKYKTHAAVVITDLFDSGGRAAGTLVTLNIPLS